MQLQGGHTLSGPPSEHSEVILVERQRWYAFVWDPPLSVYCRELMLSRLVVACARSCVCFEFVFELNVKFTIIPWEDTSFVLVGSCIMVAQCLVVDWCTNTYRVARLIVSHLISSHQNVFVFLFLYQFSIFVPSIEFTFSIFFFLLHFHPFYFSIFHWPFMTLQPRDMSHLFPHVFSDVFH